MRRRQQHQHLTASEPNHNPRGSHSSVTGSSSPRFGYNIGDPGVSPSDNPTKYPSTMPIIKPTSVSSENPTKDLSHVPKEFTSTNPSKILIEYPSGDQTGATSIIPTDNKNTKPISQTSSDPDVLKRGIQKAQLSLQRMIIMFILHIILT